MAIMKRVLYVEEDPLSIPFFNNYADFGIDKTRLYMKKIEVILERLRERYEAHLRYDMFSRDVENALRFNHFDRLIIELPNQNRILDENGERILKFHPPSKLQVREMYDRLLGRIKMLGEQNPKMKIIPYLEKPYGGGEASLEKALKSLELKATWKNNDSWRNKDEFEEEMNRLIHAIEDQ